MRKSVFRGLISSVFFVVMGCQGIHSLNLLGTSDQQMANSVNTAFLNNPELASLPIQIGISNGIVVLNGYVKTIRQSDTAWVVASNVAGVKGVENNLVVRK